MEMMPRQGSAEVSPCHFLYSILNSFHYFSILSVLLPRLTLWEYCSLFSLLGTDFKVNIEPWGGKTLSLGAKCSCSHRLRHSVHKEAEGERGRRWGSSSRLPASVPQATWGADGLDSSAGAPGGLDWPNSSVRGENINLVNTGQWEPFHTQPSPAYEGLIKK